MSDLRTGPCAECGAPLAGDQRYCLACGARAGSRSPQLLSLLARIRPSVGAQTPVAMPTDAAGAAVAADGAGGRRGLVPSAVAVPAVDASSAAGLRLPPARVSAALVILCAAFGVLLGAASGSRVDSTLAASARRPLRLVLPAAPASAPAEAPASGGGEAPSSEAPSSETPEAEAAAPATTPSAPAAAPAPTAPSEAGTGESSKGSSNEGGGEGTARKLTAIKHVFVVMLAEQPYASVFGPQSPAHYLAGTLERRGALLARYDAVAHQGLANAIALVSGQGPTAQTAANCPTYADVTPATIGAQQQVLGDGCVYPQGTVTIASQLAAKHRTWRAYVEGIGAGAGEAPACSHPALGAPDPSATAPSATGGSPAGTYATSRNPFVYFHALIDSPACAASDVGLARLQRDLAAPARTPSLSYIVPDRCHDGSPTPCSAGAPAGMAPADVWLRQIVPEITGSRAYANGGLLVITVDEAPSSGEFADSSSCCGQPLFPNLPPPAPTGPTGHGGGTVGALLLSPFIKGPVTSQEPYSHFSLLRTIEQIFELPPLGYAALPSVKPFEASLFSAKAKG